MYNSSSNEDQKPHSWETTASTATGVPVSSKTQSSNYEQPHHEPFQLKPKIRNPWSTGLCDCFSDVRNCCITCWCPCITFGQVAEIVDKGSSSCGANGALYTLIACVTGCSCFYSCFYRTKMRQQYMLKEQPCGDCLLHCFCESCALCQEYRELKNRGYDMALGWHGNVEKHNREIGMVPVTPEEGMSR